MSNDEIERITEELLSGEPSWRPVEDWEHEMSAKLAAQQIEGIHQ